MKAKFNKEETDFLDHAIEEIEKNFNPIYMGQIAEMYASDKFDILPTLKSYAAFWYEEASYFVDPAGKKLRGKANIEGKVESLKKQRRDKQ